MARFLIRILCSLALVFAAWPAGASAAPCVEPIKPTRTVQHKGCDMPCCAKAPAKEMACHASGQPKAGLKANRACACELKAALPVAMPSEKATLSAVHLDFALPPAPLVVFTAGILRTDPTVFGGDSSPPGNVQRRPCSPRAPPVVRV